MEITYHAGRGNAQRIRRLLESVPGAVATGLSRQIISIVSRRDPVATAPGTDLNPA